MNTIRNTRGQGVIIGTILFLILLVGIFEIGLLVYAYVNADEVKCNLLWCEFTTTRTSQETFITAYNESNASSSCYYTVNGVQVNCSESTHDFPSWTELIGDLK